MMSYKPGDPNKPGDFYARKIIRLDLQTTKRGADEFARWVADGRMVLEQPEPAIEDEGLTLRNYGTRWKFANMSLE